MRNKKMLGILMLCFVVVLAVSGCSNQTADSNTTTESEPATTTTDEQPKADEATTDEATTPEDNTPKTLVAATFWIGSDADPANGWNGWTLMRTASGECLATLNENMEVEPQLADSWEIVDDLTWKFHIRQGVKFANGKDLTPEAVKSSLERVIAKDERAAANAKMESITVDGEYVIFKTTEPYGSLLNNLTEPLFIIVDTDMDDETIAKTPVTTAPYQITEYNPKVDMKLVANKNYWGGEVGLDGYTLKMIKDDATRALALQSGEVQIAQRITGTALPTLNEMGTFNILEVPSLRVVYFGLDHNNKFLKDIHVRKAISSALNREAIAKILHGEAVGAIFPPSAGYGYDKIDVQKFDVELAKKELKDGGYVDSDGDGYVEKDGEKVSLYVPIASKHSQLAEIMQAQLKEVGIEMNIEIVENAYDLLGEGNFDAFITNYVTATTGDSKRFLEQNYTTTGTDNYGHYSNPKFDEVVSKLISEFDANKRVDLSVEAQQIVNADVANIYVMSPMANVGADKSVKNMTVFPMDYYFITKDLTIE